MSEKKILKYVIHLGIFFFGFTCPVVRNRIKLKTKQNIVLNCNGYFF